MNIFNIKSIIKFSIPALITSLILGIILFYLALFTSQETVFYLNTGLTVFSFIFAVIISVGLFSAHMKNTIDAVIMGIIVAILTSFLQSFIINLFMGRFMESWFNTNIGNQIILLVFAGVIMAYIGNTYLKEKIHWKIINKCCGE